MKNKSIILASAVLFSSSPFTYSHISVGGDRTLNGGSHIDGLTVENSSRSVSSSFGWADGTDDNWGDSHRLTAFKFTLASTQDVTITVARRNDAGQSGAFDFLLPAFSLFTTAAFVSGTHDSRAATTAYLTGLFGDTASGESFTDLNSSSTWNVGETYTDSNGNGVYDGPGIGNSGKEGAFRALQPWSIFNDSAQEMAFHSPIGHAADGTSANFGNAPGIVGDGLANGNVSATFSDLAAGDYYLFVGGANYFEQNNEQATYPTYGIGVTVTAVPEPASLALLAGAAATLLFRRNRKLRVANHNPTHPLT